MDDYARSICAQFLGKRQEADLGAEKAIDPLRETWLAITTMAHKRLQLYGPIMAGFTEFKVNLLIFDPETETIMLWQH